MKSSYKQSLASAVLLSLLTSSNASLINVDRVGEGSCCPSKAQGADIAAFDQTTKQPNVTGSTTLPGVNLDGNADSKFTLSESIRELDLADGQSLTHVVVNLKIEPEIDLGPDGANEDKVLCAFWFSNVTAEATEDSKEDDGSCSNALGDECTAGIRDALNKALTNDKPRSCTDVKLTEWPEACASKLGNQYEDTTVTGSSGESSEAGLFYATSHPHPRDDFATYDAAASAVHPFLFFGLALNKTADDTSSVACLRASDFAEGSRKAESHKADDGQGEDTAGTVVESADANPTPSDGSTAPMNGVQPPAETLVEFEGAATRSEAVGGLVVLAGVAHALLGWL
ncbi:MAG: hypothetical protein M1833_006708 [Piccolia ochrophora]|nr:MAG: hypothetical protein M1833_006708 [Piccolia ochrophora]